MPNKLFTCEVIDFKVSFCALSILGKLLAEMLWHEHMVFYPMPEKRSSSCLNYTPVDTGLPAHARKCLLWVASQCCVAKCAHAASAFKFPIRTCVYIYIVYLFMLFMFC